MSRAGSSIEQRHKRLLTKAKKNPHAVLRDRRCLKPAFCERFFDHCHDMALQEKEKALELAAIAAELAQMAGDKHLIHRAEGVRVHAHIANEQSREAAEVLDDYRLSALTCCQPCASDWHLRQGDLRVEDRDVAGAGKALERSIDSLGTECGDGFARICFVRGIDHHFAGDPGRALDDLETTLTELDLLSPQGYFVDALAFVSCFLQPGHERCHDEQARRILDLLRDRLKGLEGWTPVRTRHAWVDGQVSARLGDWRRAQDHLGKARRDLRDTAPPKHVLAAGVDHCQLLAWRLNDATRRKILQALKYYEAVLDLEPPLKKRLHKVIKTVSSQQRYTLQALTALRCSFIVPVPGIVQKAPRRKTPHPPSPSPTRPLASEREGTPALSLRKDRSTPLQVRAISSST